MDIHRWCLIDGAVLKAGGVDVVRGALGPLDELDFILKDSESKAVIAMPLYTLTKPKTNPKPL